MRERRPHAKPRRNIYHKLIRRNGISIIPSGPLPPVPDIELNENLVAKLVDANRKIAVLDGLACRIPNMDLFISMYVRKEALLSSQIEGTQCTLDDIL